jgi:hypothetical protein
MKRLTCEVCGGTDLCKREGAFACQSCGTKYSVEEARKMMAGGMAEANRETATADDTAKVENYLRMAGQAIDSGNNAEAEKYCDFALEIDPKRYLVWLFKAKAIARQVSTDRFEETARCLISGMKYASEEDKNTAAGITCKFMAELCMTSFMTCCVNFANSPDKENSLALNEKLKKILTEVETYTAIDAVKSFQRDLLSGNKEKLEEKKEEVIAVLRLKNIRDELADMMMKLALTKAWDKVWKNYQGDEGKPNDEDQNDFLFRSKFILVLTKSAITLMASGQSKAQAYQLLVTVSEANRDAQSWQKRNGIFGAKWVPSCCLKDETKQKLQAEIDGYKREIAKLEGALKSK